MRAIPTAFAPYQYSASKEPMIVVEIAFDDAGTDLIYLTSHTDTPWPVGAVSVPGTVVKVSSTSQQIEPDQGRSSIGTITAEILDKSGAFSTLLKAHDDAGRGIRYSRVRVYMGFRGMSWATISTNLIQTQIVDDLKYNEGVYKIVCADVQRSARKDIFNLTTTTLSSTIGAADLLIPIWSVDGFQRVAHGSTYTDAPNQEVGYIKIENEVIRWSGWTVDSTLGLCFVVPAGGRGALGTRAVAHEVDNSASTDRKMEVTEFVYLELPAVKLIYALLTGNLYGQAGKKLPDGWHLGITGAYVRTADFINIGVDLWNSATDDGLVVRFAGEEAQDGKQFIEQQLCLLIACYMPIYSNGELGLRRFTSVLHDAPHVFEINDTNIVKPGELSIDIRSVYNVLSVEWNYDHLQDKTTRQKILVDQDSIAKYKNTPTKSLKFRGLHGSRHTTGTVEGLFDRLRDRYAAPPHRISMRCLPYLNFLEVGDIVRVNTSSVRDYFRADQRLNRAFEVQRRQVDWVTGQVDFDLFGSTHPAGDIAPANPGNGNPDAQASVLPDSWYSASGTDIAALGAALTTTLVSGVRHITGGTGIIGSNALGGTRIYCTGDLELDAGVALSFTKNVLLVVNGHVQINGLLNGKGNGKAGAAAVAAANYDSKADGVAGYLGPTLSGGGYQDRYVRISGPSNNQTWLDSAPGYQTAGAVSVVPRLALTYDNGVLAGLPTDLQGSGGSTGHVVDTGAAFIAGGAGGNGGGGLVIIARGVSFGAAGEIRTSGNDGSLGAVSGNHRAGSGGGGAPGAVIIVIDGLANEIPDLSHITAIWGSSPIPAGVTPLTQPSVMVLTTATVNVNPPYYTFYTGYAATPPDMSGYGGASRIQFVPPTNVPQEDVPKDTSSPLAIALSELLNTPATVDRSYSTIEVTVTAPGVSNYKYANVYYKKSGDTVWQIAGAAADEIDVVLPADGLTYNFRAWPVSISDVETPNGPTASITTTSAATNLPIDVRDIHLNFRDGFIEIYWAALSDVRGIDYEIRLGTSWSQSVVLGQTSTNSFRANSPGTYWIRSRVLLLDGSTLYSANPQSVVITTGSITANVLASYDEFVSGLPGTLDSNALIVSSKIRLKGTANVLTLPDFLGTANILASGGYPASGSYTASTHTVNVGREAPCAISVMYASHNEDSNNNPTDAELTRVRPQINVGNNAGTYAGWQDYKPGVYFGRYFQFRIVLESIDGTSTPVITAFAFVVDVPDRIDDGSITTLTSGPVTLTHSPAFNGGNGPSGVPVVTANIVGGSAGDQLFVTSVSNSSVAFEVKNAGASVARTVHYSIQGY